MTPLRRRMLDALVLHGKAKRTQDAYISAVAQLARYYRCSPDTLSGAQIEAYLKTARTESPNWPIQKPADKPVEAAK